jgi:hypothetical protein
MTRSKKATAKNHVRLQQFLDNHFDLILMEIIVEYNQYIYSLNIDPWLWNRVTNLALIGFQHYAKKFNKRAVKKP